MTKEIIFFDGFPIKTLGNDKGIIIFYGFPIKTLGNDKGKTAIYILYIL